MDYLLLDFEVMKTLWTIVFRCFDGDARVGK